MKQLLLFSLLLGCLYGTAAQCETHECAQIAETLQSLKQERSNETFLTRTLYFFGRMIFADSDKTVDEKIQLLELQLSQCRQERD